LRNIGIFFILYVSFLQRQILKTPIKKALFQAKLAMKLAMK